MAFVDIAVNREMMPHTIEFWEPEEQRTSPSSPRPTHPRQQADHFDNSCPIPDYNAMPPRASYHPSMMHPPPHPPHPHHGMYAGWKPYHAYAQAPVHPGYYYPPLPPPPSMAAVYPPEPFRPPPTSLGAPAPKAPRPPPVVTIVNPRFETQELIYDINDHDVLCGRGAPTSWHPGNQFFRLLVDKYQGQYLAAKRMDKPEIAMHVVALVQERGGRFLKRTKVVSSSSSSPRRSSHPSSSSSPLIGSRGHFAWQDIGEQRAYEKACQALREGAPEIRKHLASKEAIAAGLHSDPRTSTSNSGGHGGGTKTNPSSPFSSSSTTAEARNDVESTSDEDGCRSFQD
jgi:hypothetical protein